MRARPNKCSGCDRQRILYRISFGDAGSLTNAPYWEEAYCRECYRRAAGHNPKPEEKVL